MRICSTQCGITEKASSLRDGTMNRNIFSTRISPVKEKPSAKFNWCDTENISYEFPHLIQLAACEYSIILIVSDLWNQVRSIINWENIPSIQESLYVFGPIHRMDWIEEGSWSADRLVDEGWSRFSQIRCLNYLTGWWFLNPRCFHMMSEFGHGGLIAYATSCSLRRRIVIASAVASHLCNTAHVSVLRSLINNDES